MNREPSDEPRASADDEASVAETRSNSGIKAAFERGLAGEALSKDAVLESVGGVRGITEALVPGMLYLVTFALTQQVMLSVVVPVLAATAAIVLRLAQRKKVMPAIAGLIGVVACSLTTILTGNPEDYFLPGLVTNSLWFLGLLVSVLLRWPLLGFVLGFLSNDTKGWRANQKLRGLAYLTTYLWMALFALRLLVQVPLFLADRTEWLGIARLTMGVPLFALAVILTWMLSKSVVEKSS